MKCYAQHGAQAGEKVRIGVQQGLVDGVIYSPRDISLLRLQDELNWLAADYPRVDRILDPQYYTCLLAGSGETRLGNLPADYTAYFRSRRRSDLGREEILREDIDAVLRFQVGLNVTHVVAPNVLISRSLDSREAATAIDFVRLADSRYAELGDQRPVYVTLAISRDAILHRQALLDFVDEITGLESGVSGFYLLVAANSTEARTEIFNSDVIAAWMYLNYALSSSGYAVINGYSDILTPLLSAAGGRAGATGWWSNLRTFSLDRFNLGPGGGRLPVQRYLCNALLNRITFSELHGLRTLTDFALNGLSTDGLYPEEMGSEPQRNREVHQSWESIRNLCVRLSPTGTERDLRLCLEAIRAAQDNYARAGALMAFEPKSNDEHLDAMEGGIGLFAELAELSPPA